MEQRASAGGRKRAIAREVFIRGEEEEEKNDGHIAIVLSVSWILWKAMARSQLISLSRLWYTLGVLSIQLVLVYFGIKQCYANDRLPWPKSSPPKVELFIQKICLLTSLVLLGIFIYPSLFRIRNLANDEQQLTINDFPPQARKQSKSSLCTSLWHHCFALSSTLHLIISFLIVISTVLIDGKQMMVGLKDSGTRMHLIWAADRSLMAMFV